MINKVQSSPTFQTQNPTKTTISASTSQNTPTPQFTNDQLSLNQQNGPIKQGVDLSGSLEPAIMGAAMGGTLGFLFSATQKSPLPEPLKGATFLGSAAAGLLAGHLTRNDDQYSALGKGAAIGAVTGGVVGTAAAIAMGVGLATRNMKLATVFLTTSMGALSGLAGTTMVDQLKK